MKVIFAGPEHHCTDQVPFDEDTEATVFGCSSFLPGHNLDALMREPNVRGAVGLVVPPEAVCYREPIRARMANVLNELLSHVFTMDELSAEWLLHWGLHATVGGHPAWLAQHVPCSIDVAPHVVTTVEGAFIDAVTQHPFVLYLQDPSKAQEHPLVRWAATYGWTERLALGGEARARLLKQAEADPARFRFPLERIQLERGRAQATLRRLCGAVSSTSTVASFVDSVLGPAPQVVASNSGVPTRRMTPGDIFDPTTHYDAAYYDGVIHYQQADGTWAMYRGPARDWEGFTEAARAFDSVLGRRAKGRSVDIGCGAGSFVDRLLGLGWDARGLDISKAAVAGAAPHLRDRIHQADLSKPEQLPREPARLVTALDFWEHIFPEDLDTLVDGVRRLLEPKGLHVAIICTSGRGEHEFVAHRGERVTKENSWALVSGHVHLRRWGWWAKYFVEKGFKLRGDLADLILVRLAEGPMRQSLSWSARNLLVVEKG